MHSKLIRIHAKLHKTRHATWPDLLPLLFLIVWLILSAPASAAMRFQERSLYINDIQPGATTSYKVSFRYMSALAVGSVDMLFCIDPIPHHPCVTPPGLDVSNAMLVDQTGETGFSILSKSTNHIVLTRDPEMISTTGSSYTFEDIINPTITNQSFGIRLRSHATTNATGPQIDFGTVMGQITDGIIIQTQVPPMLIFCVAEEVEENCTNTNDVYYTDLGELDHNSTLTAQSQMAVGTNATAGFSITVNGAPLSAGTNVIESLDDAAESTPGVNQFGINLVANSIPFVGSDPEGTWTNAVPTSDYGTPDQYKFLPGDEIAYSPNVSLMKKFTVSYIINSREDIRPGIYSTTITYIASGRF